ncbi:MULTISPECIES: metal ABC transporter solute-binding protein, Zn/Mn family [unclassified Planococcus (in: firmicutes)]|uniref:metal ABC transporter solute-binding protein, Zn/Mn family n=1 Tax=unclassified Planococcus (in: firmicutes) TaxID=2662419 RepID=UPI000C7BD1E3|nr:MULTISPECIES: zinc ABC transporter substrate-binding protein [unclassified Planococcus (in: firmicutes)]PKG46425.1 adhesin [Planococcus sp. Urea-trap-24]PKG89361.1 adhesin [Planococcus sp. Urea-3u-39]PKH41168.1 adhesin [Planococcus sp. MB-3u-09]
MKKLAYFAGIALILLLAACGSNTETDSGAEGEAAEGKLDVYATVYPLVYFAERIGGERVDVKSVYPAGANEHSFEPTQKDMINMADADLLFYVGLGLEGFIDSAQETLQNEDLEFVATADGITDEQLEAVAGAQTEAHSEDEQGHEEEGHEGHDHGSTDPHVWISPVLSQELAASVRDALAEKDPEGAEEFDKNYEELVAELEALDESFQNLGEKVERDTFFVSHSAFGYIAAPYGFEQVAVAGLNSQDEPSQKELTEIVDMAREKDIQYIVFEQNVSSNLTEVIQNEVGAEAIEMHNLGVLTQENIDNDETYFTLMEKNLQALETVLK